MNFLSKDLFSPSVERRNGRTCSSPNSVNAIVPLRLNLNQKAIASHKSEKRSLGYRFPPQGLGVARVTVVRMVERVSRFYEQGLTASRIGEYARRWWRWVRSGVSRVELGEEGKGAITVVTEPAVAIPSFFSRVGDGAVLILTCLFDLWHRLVFLLPLLFVPLLTARHSL